MHQAHHPRALILMPDNTAGCTMAPACVVRLTMARPRRLPTLQTKDRRSQVRLGSLTAERLAPPRGSSTFGTGRHGTTSLIRALGAELRNNARRTDG